MTTCSGNCSRNAAVPRVRRASPDDTDLLAEMVHELAAYEDLADSCRVTEDALRQYLFGPEKAAEALIAWLDEAPVGFAIYYRTFSSFAARPGIWIEDLFVRSPFRRRGAGRLLLSSIARIAHQSGAGRLEWNTLRWNDPARRLYASVGATELDDWLQFRLEPGGILALAGGCRRGEDKAPSAGCRCGGTGPHHQSQSPSRGGGGCKCS